jgi:hypothetical protein
MESEDNDSQRNTMSVHYLRYITPIRGRVQYRTVQKVQSLSPVLPWEQGYCTRVLSCMWTQSGLRHLHQVARDIRVEPQPGMLAGMMSNELLQH